MESKKRKFSSSSGSEHGDDEFTDDDVYQEMNIVNTQLISLAKKVLRVDHQYFVEHSEMVNEFIGNMQLFMSNVDSHRKNVASQRLNGDILSYVYQFLETIDLLTSCQFVSKLWRGTLSKASLTIKLGSNLKTKKDKLSSFLVDRLMKFEFINNVTSLTMKRPGLDAITTMHSKHSKLSNLKSLSLIGADLGVRAVDYLLDSKSLYNSITELSFADSTRFDQRQLGRILTSDFSSNLTSLDLSNIAFEEHFFRTASNSVHLKQKLKKLILTSTPTFAVRNGLSLLLDSVAPNIEYLDLTGNNLDGHVQIALNNMSKVKTLILTKCVVFSIKVLVSLNYTSMTTLKIDSLHTMCVDIQGLYRHPTTHLTDLDISSNMFNWFQHLIAKSPALKRLKMTLGEDESEKNGGQLIALDSSSLEKLEFLDVSGISSHTFMGVMQRVFTKPYFSNLRVLRSSDSDEFLDSELLKNCTTLTHLRELSMNGVEVSPDGVRALNENVTFKNLELIEFANYNKQK